MTTAPEPRLDAFDITRRAREAYGPDGRPPLPNVASWPISPFELDGLKVRHLEDPVVPEPPRSGEWADDCWTCRAGDERFVPANSNQSYKSQSACLHGIGLVKRIAPSGPVNDLTD